MTDDHPIMVHHSTKRSDWNLEVGICFSFSRFTNSPVYDIPTPGQPRLDFVPVMTVMLAMMSQHPELVEFQVAIMKQS